MAPENKRTYHDVLVVEDEPDLASLMSDTLSAAGFTVYVSHTVTDACSKLANQQFDCVILDLRLKHKSGEVVIEHMRTKVEGFNFRTPIIVVSANLDPGTLKKIGPFIQGALVKPVDENTLIAKVKSLIQSQSPAPG